MNFAFVGRAASRGCACRRRKMRPERYPGTDGSWHWFSSKSNGVDATRNSWRIFSIQDMKEHDEDIKMMKAELAEALEREKEADALLKVMD